MTLNYASELEGMSIGDFFLNTMNLKKLHPRNVTLIIYLTCKDCGIVIECDCCEQTAIPGCIDENGHNMIQMSVPT